MCIWHIYVYCPHSDQDLKRFNIFEAPFSPMTAPQGRWIRERQSPHPSAEGKAAVKEQHEKIAAAGKLIKERCSGKTGDNFKTCKSDVLRELFGKKKEV